MRALLTTSLIALLACGSEGLRTIPKTPATPVSTKSPPPVQTPPPPVVTPPVTPPVVTPPVTPPVTLCSTSGGVVTLGDGAPGCGTTEICGNGLDDNCDGHIDENCPCTPGDVQSCFGGPPGERNIGVCTDGKQTCQGSTVGSWGPCVGGINPSPEVCDGLDNNCNNCIDEGLTCGSLLACPSSVPDVKPFATVSYNGAQYYKGPTSAWKWTVSGGPCDKLFLTTTNPVVQSFQVGGAATNDLSARYTLSGDYTVNMTATGTDGKTYACEFIQHVAAPGVRFELCWDHTGFFNGVDLDLHVHRSGITTDWFGATSATPNPDDCFYDNCTSDSTDKPQWYSATPPNQCIAASATNKDCDNPRLDIDNITDNGVPENTNIDNPNDGDTLRAMVHYFSGDGAQHPIVNVYCGGVLKTTYGQAPDTLACPGPACFDTAGGFAKGDMWRVADVTAIVDANGNTTDCTVMPIHGPDPAPYAGSGYYVTKDVVTY